MDARYRAQAATPSVLRHRAGALRVLAVLVLAGLWLMHGVSATTEAGCHGVPVMMSMSASAAGSGSAMVADAGVGAKRADMSESDATPGVRAAGTEGSGHSGPGEMCLSGQPPSPHDLLLGLLATFALLGLAFGMAEWLGQPSMRGWSRVRRRGPPGQAGRAVLTMVCISRT
jgi:hypothetical protein